MNKDNLTIRIAINKPRPPEPVAPKKKRSLPLLVAALLIPALSFGLYQMMKPKQMPLEPLDSSVTQTSPPLALSEPEPSKEVNPGTSIMPISTTGAKPTKKLSASSSPLPNKSAPNQIRTNKPKQVSSSHHNAVANTKEIEEKEIAKQVAARQLIHALPAFLQRAQLSMGITKREPQNALSSQVTLSELPEQRLYMFTELSGKAGETIHHRWLYKNKVMASIPIKVGGDHWRCYSSKRVNENYLGKWVVEITDEQGKVLYTQSINLNG